MADFKRLFRLAEQRVASILGLRPEQLEVKVKPSNCLGCQSQPLVHKNKDGTVEIRCVTPACPDPRWLAQAASSEREAVLQWNLMNQRPPRTPAAAREGLKGTGSRDRFASRRDVFGDERN